MFFTNNIRRSLFEQSTCVLFVWFESGWNLSFEEVSNDVVDSISNQIKQEESNIDLLLEDVWRGQT